MPIALGAFLIIRANGKTGPLLLGAFIVVCDVVGFAVFVRRLDDSRRLPPDTVKRIAQLREVRPNLHVVDFHLRDGSVVKKRRVMWGERFVMPPWRRRPPFRFEDIVDVTEHPGKVFW